MLGGAALDSLGTVGLLALAMLVSVVQWLLLRIYRPISPVWIPMTTLGSLGGLGAGAVVGTIAGYLGFTLIELAGFDVIANNYKGSPIPLLVDIIVLGAGAAGLTMGYILGLCQLHLWRGHTPTTQGWLAASCGGVAVATMVAGLDLFAREFQHPVTEGSPSSYVHFDTMLFPSGVISGLVFGLLYGVIIAVALVRLLHQPTEASLPQG